MRTEECTITLWGHDEEITQDVRVQYTLETQDGFFEELWFKITECKVLDEIVIEPSDLITDITEGIKFQEGFQRTVFKMACKVECKIVSETVRV